MNKQSELDVSPLSQPVPIGTLVEIKWGDYLGLECHATYTFECSAVIMTSNAVGSATAPTALIAASSSSGSTCAFTQENHAWPDVPPGTESITLNYSYTNDGKTVYFAAFTLGLPGPVKGLRGNVVTPYYSHFLMNAANIAWTMIYGEEEKHHIQHIPVQWNSGYRSEPYQTSFSITVNYFDE